MNPVSSFNMTDYVPIVLAATGHRVIPIQDEATLCSAVIDQLKGIAKEYPHSPLVLISALAEGADRLTARCALELGWQLGAVLPLKQRDYESDFQDIESIDEFRKLLARASWIKTLDDENPSRPECYGKLALWLSQQAQVLIALWDGEVAMGHGGTAEVIQIFREGIPLTQPLLPDAGPVIHIQTRRKLDQERIDHTNIGSVRMLPACPGGLDSVGEISRWQAVLRRIDNFNKEATTAPIVDGQWINTLGLPLPEWAKNSEPKSKENLCRNIFQAANNLSIAAQRERDRMFLGLLGFSALAALLSQIYSSLFSLAILLVCAVGLIGIGACWYLVSRGRNLEERYLDYRALAEACRVQYFWKLVGIKESAAVHYLREQRDELEWIRQALQTTELGADEFQDVPLKERFEFLRHEWIDDQLNYFGGGNQGLGKAGLNHLNNLKWSRRSRILFLLGMTLTVLTSIFHTFIADTRIPLHDWVLRSMIVGYCLFFAASGLVKVYQETRAFAEHAKRYERMGLALQISRSRLDVAIESGDLEQAVDIVKALGIEALAENGNWLLMHRERPVLVQGIG